MSQADWSAGYEFSVTIDGVAYPFAKVDLGMTAKEINRANSKYDPGFSVIKAGIKGLTFDLEGPWKPDEAALEVGAEYTWLYYPYAAHLGYEFLGIILDISHQNDQEDGPRMNVKVKAQSDFDPIMVS